jgi:hypothetical protein
MSIHIGDDRDVLLYCNSFATASGEWRSQSGGTLAKTNSPLEFGQNDPYFFDVMSKEQMP